MSPAANKIFIDAIRMKCKQALNWQIAKGFVNPKKLRNEGEVIALIHSELSEALEYLRHGNPADDKIPEFSGVEAELADVVIRVFGYAGERGYRLAEAIVAKMLFNEGRAQKNGGKKF